MSGAADHTRRTRPQKMYMVESEHRVLDQLEGTILLARGSLCVPQEGPARRSRKGDQLWVKVLDSGSLVKVYKQVLLEVPTDLAGLMEPISDPEVRFQLFIRPQQLQRLAALPLGAELCVKLGQSGELAEAVLRYRGTLASGSTAVYFGLQLKGGAAGQGSSNGSYKGHQLFHCPEACAVFVAASRLVLRSSPHTCNMGHEAGGNHGNILSRTADSTPSPAPVPQERSGGSSDGWFKENKPPPQLPPLPPVSKATHEQRPPNSRLLNNPSSPPLASMPLTPPSPASTNQSRRPHRSPPPLSPSKTRLEVGCDRAEEAGLEAELGAGLEAGLEAELEVGSMVEVNDPPLYGVIRWIGQISGIPERVAGLELDEELAAATDGSYRGDRYFRCPANKGLFVKLRNCRRDSRFPAPETPANQVERCNSVAFAEWVSERVEEHTPPLFGAEARERYTGRKRGIQGHLNSCYLDASLFSVFSCCSSLDWLLLCPSRPHDGPNRGHAQDLLRCDIINPLRRYGYVCASKTMALRRLLEAECNDTGFTHQEKDPEEFLNNLFQLLRVEPLLKIRSGRLQAQECHLYQLFPPVSPPLAPPSSPGSSPRCTDLRVSTVQTLLQTSFLHAGLKFAEAPSCLLLLMPRFGKDYKMYDAIIPSLSLDITDLLDHTLRQCSICQSVAEWECNQCYEDPDITPGRLKQFCHTCNTQVHSHRKRASHRPERLNVPDSPWAGPVHGARQRLVLFAVTCIETSHYVSFVKHGPLSSDWLFFDSMADRKGGQNGFNVPQVTACPEVSRYLSLSEEELGRLDSASLNGSARRLLCDAYMCLYHSPELSLYK